MSRFSKLIDQLEDLDQQDIKNTAKVFSVASHLYERLNQIVESQEPKQAVLPAQKITKELLIKKYGSYSKAYQVYQETYGIKSKRGWKHLIPLIKDLPIPMSAEERLANLEKKVDLLSEILLDVISK